MEITRNAADGCMELTITGRLDGYWADHLDSGLTETVRDGHHHLRLDPSGVTFLSSAGIAVLDEAIRGHRVVRDTGRGRRGLQAVVNVSPAWRALRSVRASAPRRPDCR